MAVTNVFFEFPCFIERWLVNINNNAINCEYFVNKNDIIGHVRLDNNNITSFRAPVSGYLTILIRENVRVRKGLNVAAIYPNPTHSNSNSNSSPNQIQNIQNIQNVQSIQNIHHQSNPFNARYQTQPQLQPQTNINPHPSQPHNINMNLIPTHNISYHQIRHSPHHNIPMNRPPHPHPPPPHPLQHPPPQYIHNRPPQFIHHATPIYTNQTYQTQPPQPQQPKYTPNNIQIQESKTNTLNNTNINVKTTVHIPENKSNKSPTDPRKSAENKNRQTTPENKNINISPNTTPNAMFTKHWNLKVNSASNLKSNISENISKIKTNLHKNKKLLLVLDIDHTLVHATRDIRAKDILKHEIIGKDVYEIEFIDPSCTIIGNAKQIYWVKLRPFLRKFLSVLKQFFCLAIYTMGIRPYADEILKIIDPDSTIFEHRMICRGDIGINQINGMKNISHLPQCDPKMILIADDRDDVWTTPNNVVKVHKFKYWPNENNLAIETIDLTQTNVVSATATSDNNPITNQLTREQLFPWNKDCILEKDASEPWNLERLKAKSNDNILYNTANILQSVHYIYYSNIIGMEDCRKIYCDMKKLVFKGVKCAFSGVIPTNEDPRNHPLWKLIETYGGEPTDCLSNDCTHLIAAKPGTFKVTKSNEMNIWVVHYNWVYQSVIEFVKCKEINFINLIKPNNITSFIPNDIHVKPKEFGKMIQNIRNGNLKIPKIETKHQFQKRRIMEEKLKIKNIKNNNNKIAMDIDVKMEEKKPKPIINGNVSIINDKMNNMPKLEKMELKKDAKIINLNKNESNDIIMENKNKIEDDCSEEEGEIKESSPTPPLPDKININNGVNIVINNNTKNDIVIQLPPPNNSINNNKNNNKSEQITSELPEYIQLPKRNKNKNKNKIENNQQININNNNTSMNNNSTTLPSHIALPEKNKTKILRQHQSNVAKLRILNSDIQSHHKQPQTQTQITPLPQPQSQMQIQQHPKPQIIRLEAPKLNQLRCTVPTIPLHLRQQQYPIKPIMIHRSNNNDNYIPVSMQLPVPPPPNAITHSHSHRPIHSFITQPQPQPQPPPPNAVINTMIIPQQLSHAPMNLLQQVPVSVSLPITIPPPPPPIPQPQPQKKILQQQQHPGDKDYRKDKHSHKDYADIDHRKIRDRMDRIDRDRERMDRYGRNNSNNNRHSRNNNNNSKRGSRSHTSSRSRSRSRSRSPYYSNRKQNNNRNKRDKNRNNRNRNSRSRSISPFYNRSHSSSLSSRHNRDRRRKKNNNNNNNNGRKYQIIGGKKSGYNNNNNNNNNNNRRRHDDNMNWNDMNDDDDDDGFDQLLQSYAGSANKYSGYNRYSDEEQKIDYGVDSNDKDNGKKGGNDDIDYGAI